MRYEVNAGRISTWSLEVHVVDHCNLRCAHCCTLSPSLPERFVDPEAFARDLALAAGALAPATLKLTGGEPLLHPQLSRLVEIARESRLAPILSMTTNGLLAAAAPARVLELLDRVTLSLYPSAPLPPQTLATLRARCAEHEVELVEKEMNEFQVMDAPAPHGDDGAAVFAGCWMRHRCHMLRDGHFFLCTRPPHLARAAAGADFDAEEDGVALARPDLLARLLRMLEREDPLSACRHCLGASGAWQPHQQLARIRTAPA